MEAASPERPRTKGERERHTCLAAMGSFPIPHPWRKQFASSKMASTSSPLAAPPFLRPACSAICSTAAALEAALERNRTARSGSGVHPQPCLQRKIGGRRRSDEGLAHTLETRISNCDVGRRRAWRRLFSFLFFSFFLSSPPSRHHAEHPRRQEGSPVLRILPRKIAAVRHFPFRDETLEGERERER